MIWSFEFLGRSEDRAYFCIMTDDEQNNGQGVSVRYHYYAENADNSLTKINYMQVPTFRKKPARQEAALLMDRVIRFFNGWIPSNIQLMNK
ncbi:hypothetical protein J2S74_002934 [Evansella vedderi]|uniref:Uncharacterized protein n=1 Tax=Evansella vedderi TaxID=38282 RepID=A0ABT9ZXV4_9BACI|nr:hypothetical protein [Evansella vedderi]MDQ0255552.1 hypothetical protein [Evansella vedderi]